jgi:hypothetical protein
VGLGRIACDGLLEEGRKALSELEELPVFLIDDDSTAKWWAAAEMPDEELTKCKIMPCCITKEPNALVMQLTSLNATW